MIQIHDINFAYKQYFNSNFSDVIFDQKQDRLHLDYSIIAFLMLAFFLKK